MQHDKHLKTIETIKNKRTNCQKMQIKNGEIAGMLRDVAYQANSQEFWNSCSKVCDESDYRLSGSFFDGKGQPSQSSAVSHGSSTTRFDGINVINTARNI
jgi:TldD protein